MDQHLNIDNFNMRKHKSERVPSFRSNVRSNVTTYVANYKNTDFTEESKALNISRGNSS